jgi:hypothetical protein
VRAFIAAVALTVLTTVSIVAQTPREHLDADAEQEVTLAEKSGWLMANG